MAAHAILNFGKYDNYVDETFAWYKWVRSLDDNSSNIPKTHDVISYRLAISSGSVFVEPGRNSHRSFFTECDMYVTMNRSVQLHHSQAWENVWQTFTVALATT